MPDSGNRVLVTNTTPLIALTAATGGLEILRHLYARVVVPLEVAQEVRVGGAQAFGVEVFNAAASWLGCAARTGAPSTLASELARQG